MEVHEWPIDKVKPYDKNPRNNDGAVEATANSIKEFGWQQPIVVDKNGVIIVGHTRLKAAISLGLNKVPVLVADKLSAEQVAAYRLADNKTSELADWDFDLLSGELDDIENIDMSEFGFGDDDLNGDPMTTKEKIAENPLGGSLADSFLMTPSSVLDARATKWQERKKKWKSLGIASEVGRDGHLAYAASMDTGNLNGTSIFDPVLCELGYSWFMPDNGNKIFDPFAGGSVRGVVASILGREYTGIDLRSEQVEANKANASEIGVAVPRWFADDSINMDKYVDDGSQDLVFTCPPYADLEVYSDDPRDISNMPDDEFDAKYAQIITKAIGKLKDNRFAVITIQDVRGKDGFYRDLQRLTIEAAEAGGARYYNDMVLLTALASGIMRARKSMNTRKVVHAHQNVMVFFKGDWHKIKDEFSPLVEYFDALEDTENNDDTTIE